MNMNVVIIAGNLTRDVEMSYTPKGTAVAKFSLAVNRVWNDDSGQKHEKVAFIDCEAWGRTAEVLEEHTGKGHSICVEGRLDQDSWEDKTSGQKRSKLKVTVEKFHFAGRPKGEEEREERPPARQPQRPAQRPPQRQAPPPPQRKPVDPDLDAPEEDDIPF